MTFFRIGTMAAVGGASRCLIGMLAPAGLQGVIIANLIGCFFFGLMLRYTGRFISERVAQSLQIGFCGGLTTFASLAVDVQKDLGTEPTQACIGLFTCLVGGSLAIVLGALVARTVTRVLHGQA